MNLEGSSAVVTGASSGIGEAIALELASRGARLTLTARREDRLDELGGRITSTGGEAPLLVAADLRKAEDITRIFEESRARWGGAGYSHQQRGARAQGGLSRWSD